ncbi:DNA adenine methyltransferase YhdJ [invertebrate metagenome]|uniref:DNA adenine methyltransferase YhdJ n=1 Tax=invertebrate metagenome TaxID=1711999 RepID=A0A2H9TBW4_9ZZZZ
MQLFDIRFSYMEITTVSLKSLLPYDRNAKLHPKAQVDQIAESIRRFGFNNPVLVDGDHTIIAGHGRVMAARHLGLDEIPVVVLSHLSDDEKRAYMLADNRIAEAGGWDSDLLSMELSDLKAIGMDLKVTGFTDHDWQGLLPEKLPSGERSDDHVPPLPAPGKTVSQPGDLWLMDGNRLLCGDSTKADDMTRLMNGQMADMVWTDPPYNVNYHGGTEGHLAIANDDMPEGEFLDFLLQVFRQVHTCSAAGCPLYVAYSDAESIPFRTALIQSGWKLSQTLVWAKHHFKLSRQDYQWQHEPVIYGWKEGAGHPWYGDRKQTSIMDANLVLDDMSHDELLKLAKAWQQVIATTVIRAKKPVASTDHPTMKPVALVLSMMMNSSRQGDLVLDPCGGSGTTLIAAQKTHRRSCLMEIDPVYCDVIVRRWQEFTGGQALHESTGKPFILQKEVA